MVIAEVVFVMDIAGKGKQMLAFGHLAGLQEGIGSLLCDVGERSTRSVLDWSLFPKTTSAGNKSNIVGGKRKTSMSTLIVRILSGFSPFC